MTSISKTFKSDKKYVSEVDKFLTRFTQQYPSKSPSQQKEIEVYQNLFYQRDTKTKKTNKQLT